MKSSKAAGIILALTIAVLTFGQTAAHADSSPEDVLGTANNLLSAISEPGATVSESTLGIAVADAVRDATGTQLAIINGGDFASDLSAGQLTRAKVEKIFTQDRELATAEVTPAQLWLMLEHGFSKIVLLETEKTDYVNSVNDAYPQISGFTVKFDASALAGNRVMTVALPDGTELAKDDNSTLLSLTATVFMFEGGYDMPSVAEYELAGITLTEVFSDYIQAQGVLQEPDTGRINIVGTKDVTILTYIPKGMLIILIAFLALCARGGKLLKLYDFRL